MSVKTIPGYKNYKISNVAPYEVTKAGVTVPTFVDDDGLTKVELSSSTSRDVISIQSLLYITWGIGSPTPGGDVPPAGKFTVYSDPIPTQKKKMVGYDQNPPTTTFVKANIEAIEASVGEGIVMAVPVTHPVLGSVQLHNCCWTANVISPEGLRAAKEELLSTNFRLKQDNFILTGLHTSRTLGERPISFLSPVLDALFETFGNIAEFCKQTKTKILWDGEPDRGFTTPGWSVWKYANHIAAGGEDIGFEAWKDQVRHCGRRWMQRMQEVNPYLEIAFTFLYDQGNTELELDPEDRTYGGYNSFLNGVFDVKKSTVKVIDYFEASYNYKTLAKWTGVDGVQLWNSKTDERWTDPENPQSDRFDAQRAGALRLDWVEGEGEYDLEDIENNYFGYDDIVTTIKAATQGTPGSGGADAFSQEYLFLYQENFKLYTVPRTVPRMVERAIREGRSETFIQMEQLFDLTTGPAELPGLICRLRAGGIEESYANDALVGQATDQLGNVFTESGGTRPKFKTNPFGTGVPSFLFTAGDLTKLVCDAIAALLAPALAEDFPYAIIAVVKPSAVSGGTFTIASFGANVASGVNPIVNLRIDSNSDLTSQRKENATTSTPITHAASITTALQILGVTSTGIGAALYRNNVQLVSSPLSQDVGPQSFDQFTVGAARSNILNNHFSGDLVDLIVYKQMPGIEELRWLGRGLGHHYQIAIAA